jgi:hypothetical protein
MLELAPEAAADDEDAISQRGTRFYTENGVVDKNGL